MSKEKRIPKEYAIVVSLVIFFTIVIITGGVRIYLITTERLDRVNLDRIDDVIELDTNAELSSYNLRIANSIKAKYGIDVYYGDIPGLESVNARPITDDKIIFNMLKDVNAVLDTYPEGLIGEIESNGYELSIYLVSDFTNNVEALANRNSIGQMKIYMSNTADITRALYHESYHVLDYYIRLETDETQAYFGWDEYNPKGFEYTQDISNITYKYVYDGKPGANFVTAYSKYSVKEDRAETFAEMITASEDEVFFNESEPIRGKMDIIKRVLYNTFETVRNESILIWE